MYVPLAIPVNEKFPDASAVTVPLAPPLNLTVAPFPPVKGVIVPEIAYL